jgi:site-specific DNA recombinase
VNLGAIPPARKRRRKGDTAPRAVGKAALYLRVSVEELNGDSIASQEAACRAECAKRDLTVAGVFVDRGFSAGTIERPALTELRTAVAAGKVAAVVVYAVDRLSRRQADTLGLLEEFAGHGVGIWSASQDFETATSTGKAMLGFLAIFAELQREEIRSRTKRALHAKMERGEAVGRTPFGVRIEARDGRKYYASAEHWPTVRGILDERQGGASCQKIANRLNAEGVLTPSERGKWSAATVARLCRSRAVRSVAESGD